LLNACNFSFTSFLQQVEEKAPLLQKQKEEYVMAMEKINQMARQLDTAMLVHVPLSSVLFPKSLHVFVLQESERMRHSAEENNRRCAELRRENKRLQQQGHDRSQQVCICWDIGLSLWEIKFVNFALFPLGTNVAS
jgi:DNA repair exonuclease SbcCD ATPase subunit